MLQHPFLIFPGILQHFSRKTLKIVKLKKISYFQKILKWYNREVNLQNTI